MRQHQPQILHDFSNGLIALTDQILQHSIENLAETLRQHHTLLSKLRSPEPIAMDRIVQFFGLSLGHQVDTRRPQTVEIASRKRPSTAQLLHGCIAFGADASPRSRNLRSPFLQNLRHAKVNQHQSIIKLPPNNICRRNISMNHMAIVNELQNWQ